MSFQGFSKNKNSRENQTQTLPFHTVLTKGYLYFHGVILLINWAVLVNVVNLFCFMNFIGVRQISVTDILSLLNEHGVMPATTVMLYLLILALRRNVYLK